MILTQAILKDLLHYDSETGIFTWTDNAAPKVKNTRAGRKHNDGYELIAIDYVSYLSHRLAWMYVYGEFPKNMIDHINGVRTDNRIANLRESTLQQNNHNRKLNSNNKSGVKGVYWNKQNKSWHARIKVNGVNKHIGSFKNIDDAEKAIRNEREKLHGQFAKHG